MPRQLFHLAGFDANGNAVDQSVSWTRGVTLTTAWNTPDDAQRAGTTLCRGHVVRVEVRMSPSLPAAVGEGPSVWEWTRPETSLERFDRLSRERAARRLSQEG